MQFTVVGLDGKDDQAMDRRLAVRPDHIATGEQLRENGNLWFAAALLDHAGKMVGSVYHLQFATQKDFDSWYETEPYVVGDVWRDVSIHKSVTRNPWQFTDGRDQNWFETYTAE